MTFCRDGLVLVLLLTANRILRAYLLTANRFCARFYFSFSWKKQRDPQRFVAVLKRSQVLRAQLAQVTTITAFPQCEAQNNAGFRGVNPSRNAGYGSGLSACCNDRCNPAEATADEVER